MVYSIAQLNAISQDEFVEAVGFVFEDTPAIARQAWHHRPFPTVQALHQQMVQVMQSLSPAEQLALIRAHPDLGSRIRMAEASVQEQAGAGLDRLSASDYARFQTLNQAYKQKFGFPFIIAVKQQSQASILEAFEQRLLHSIDAERQQALQEIAAIAEFRLRDCVR
ncbi:MAG: 2-oxo-4-hydroxy-4-carboxy-5-ureidoimidazoline decarboxylase [Leptolyngbyaceae cyanobacterium SL_7_1]|nr:2-oxo-4-hydroxy-4-carboxy-5-ureidoimidazoline decarboxylase [Leptolyngbyaceae cyanobacterium SL_7_1]